MRCHDFGSGREASRSQYVDIRKESDKAMGQNSCQPQWCRRIFSSADPGVAARIDADFVGRLGRIPDTVHHRPSRHRRFWHATHACFIML